MSSVIYKVMYIPGGAGFPPSTVSWKYHEIMVKIENTVKSDYKKYEYCWDIQIILEINTEDKQFRYQLIPDHDMFVGNSFKQICYPVAWAFLIIWSKVHNDKQAQTKHRHFKRWRITIWPLCLFGVFLQMPWPFSRGTFDETLIINEALEFGQTNPRVLDEPLGFEVCGKKRVVNHQNPLDFHWISLRLRRSGF